MTSRSLGDYAYESDPVSILVELSFSTVRWAVTQLRRCMALSFEIIIAPSYTDEALAIFDQQKEKLNDPCLAI